MWWRAHHWSSHIENVCNDQPKFEFLALPEGEIKAEPIDSNLFISEEHFEIPNPQRSVPESEKSPAKYVDEESK